MIRRTCFRWRADVYLRFRGLFNTRIAANLSSDEERFNQLLRHLTGIAYDVVAPCILAAGPTDAFAEEFEQLDREYWQKHELIRNSLEKLLTGPQVDAKNTDAHMFGTVHDCIYT